jgi:AcrR family transcriptional regulator
VRASRSSPLKRRAPRPYRQARRAESAAATRRGIIAAGLNLLEQREAPRLSLDEVAVAAKVSRATIYNQFGSRSSLLIAMMEDLGRVINYERVRTAQRLPDPVEALTATIDEATACWSSRRLTIRRILALGVLDPEVDKLNAMFEGYRRAEMGQLAQRLRDAGRLGDGVSVVDASITLGALTSPQALELVGWDSDLATATARLLRMARAALGIHST